MTEAPSAPDRWDAAIALPDPRGDRPVTLLHRIEALAADALLAWSARQDMEKASDRLGRLCRKLGPRLGKVHRRGYDNLTLTMPWLSDAEKERILRDEWENLGRTAAEFVHLKDVASRVTIEGADRLEAVRRSGKPAVFVSGHFANWEVMGTVLHRAGLKTAVVYRAANNPLVDAKIIRLRSEVMSRRLIPKGQRGGRELMAAMKDGLSLCMLTDQKLGDGIDSPLLGIPARTAPAAARLALKADLPVIPVEVGRLPGARFEVIVHEPLQVERTGDRTADTQRMTDAINRVLSAFIEKRPGQWLWFHRRWPKDASPATAADKG